MRVGFAGAGGIGRRHASVVKRLDDVEVAACFDIDRERSVAWVKEFGGKSCNTLEELLDIVDAVYVVTPPRAHRDVVLEAASRGKAIYCEKPIAVDVDDARAMVTATRECGVTFAIGFNNRFRPQVERVRELVNQGGIGEPLFCWSRRLGYNRPEPETNWRTSNEQLCGMTIESVSHDIDMLRYMIGEVASVSAVTGTSFPGLEGYEDNLSASLIMESGAIGNIHASWASRLKHSSRGVVGTTGAITIEGSDLWEMNEVRLSRATEDVDLIEAYPPRLASDLGYETANRAFIESARAGAEVRATAVDGLRALQVSTALLESARTGQSVSVY